VHIVGIYIQEYYSVLFEVSSENVNKTPSSVEYKILTQHGYCQSFQERFLSMQSITFIHIIK
jgi:hypothetical protein